ncbi:MAG: ATP-binding cassette domain-containing protein [Pirellulales bacterium]|nr:ATP-binding cassette domain-containing protein [Pirellulales bacterium]
MSDKPQMLLKLEEVTKSFPGVHALSGVDFDVRPGEVHALVGENGAGKSTLINIVSGVLQPDSGLCRLEGRVCEWRDPVAARKMGIVTVHQEADFFPTLSVVENIALQHGLPTRTFGFVDWPAMQEAAQKVIGSVGESIGAGVSADRLSVAHRHMLQVAAAVLQRAKLVILDEPTSALTSLESAWLFQQVARLKAGGVGLIYISHRQEEVFALADRITVLRDGRKIWTRNRKEVDSKSLIEAMVGRNLKDSAGDRQRRPNGSAPEGGPLAPVPRLEVRNLHDSKARFQAMNFQVGAGEIVGVYGLIGAGRTEMARGIFGLEALAGGSVLVDGKPVVIHRPQDAVRAGIAYLPEDRLREGLCRGLSIRANTVLPTLDRWTQLFRSSSETELPGATRLPHRETPVKRWSLGLLASRRVEKQVTRQVVQQLEVRQRNIEQPISQLSGGNQQKVVLGRWLLAAPKVMILDEPTRGVDVGAKSEIHRLLRSIADRGCAILMISSDMPEILQHSDRIMVLRSGKMSAEWQAGDVTATEVAEAALPDESVREQSVSTEKRAVSHNRRIAGEWGLAAVIVMLSLWLSLTSANFFSWANFGNLLAETALWSILGLAAASVIIAGGIDISIGSLLALSAACAGLLLKLPLAAEISIPLAIVGALLVGLAGGLLNGLISLVGKVHPIVVTLGMMIVYRGLVIALVSGRQISSVPEAFGWIWIYPGSGFRAVIVLGAVVSAVLYVIHVHRPAGRHLYALGSSSTAAQLVGVSRVKTWLFAFGLGGLLTGIAAVIVLSASMQMQSQLGKGWELQAIAVAVIGGVSITGGRGTVVGVVLGAVLLRLVNLALVRWEIRGEQVDVFVGGLILAAVLLDLFLRKRRT